MAQNTTIPKRFSREHLTQQRASGKWMILLIVIFTVLNMVLLVCGTERYFLFSAGIPHYLTYYGMQMDNGGFGGYFVAMLIVSLSFLAGYVLSWLMVNKNGTWLKVALILWAMDTVVLIIMAITMRMFEARIMDLAVHVLLLWEIFQALRANKRLENMPKEEQKA